MKSKLGTKIIGLALNDSHETVWNGSWSLSLLYRNEDDRLFPLEEAKPTLSIESS